MAQLESEEHVLHTASVVIHELSYGIHRLPSGRKQQRLNRSGSLCPAFLTEEKELL
jgi:hypothetical protein